MSTDKVTRDLPAPTVAGAGWSPGLTSAGYLTPVHHFYVQGERVSACPSHLRRSRLPKPRPQLPQATKFCKMCERWIQEHPNGGRRYKGK